MKLTRFICLTLIFVLFSVFVTFADNDETIRVGLESLYKDVTSCIVTNETIEIGYSEDNVFYEGATLTCEDNFFFRFPSTYFVQLPTEYQTYLEASSAINGVDKGLVGYSDNGKFNVLINASDMTVANELLSTYTDSTLITCAGTNPVLYDGNDMVVAFTNQTKKVGFKGVDEDYINVGQRKYRGYLELYPTTTNKFTLVNVVPFEEYLYAVVPSEMPSSWDIEALKAQAVSARTYAEMQMSKHISSGYNVCDTQDCQVYLGVGNESENSTNAVNQTKGEEAYYNGQLIDAVFSSSSGGVTANSEDVWNEEVPYLREKEDPYDTEGLVWSRSVTTSDLTGMLENKGQDIGVPVSISIDEVSDNGRVNKLTIIGTDGSYSLTKENIRYFFAYGSMASLPSRLFTVTSNSTSTNSSSTVFDNTSTDDYELYVTNGDDTESIDLEDATIMSAIDEGSISTDSVYVMGKDSTSSYDVDNSSSNNNGGQSVEGTEFVISGKGYGHGVGMSQYGAKGMAEAGYDYKEILKFYYTGIEIY